ncbi:MAG: guanylate kinase [bacterium]|nr:MAG: guanylate kinase [bacterium]
MVDIFDSENGRKGKGILFVLSSPSGGGKTTLAHKLQVSMEDLALSVSHTTRKPRAGEADGADYHFVSRKRFQEMIDNGEFVEWAEVHGNLYGTGRKEIDDTLRKGTDVLLDIDVQGARQIVGTFKESILIFILPPSDEEWLERLRGRGTESEAELKRRIEGAKQERLAMMPYYDYAVLNDVLDDAADALRSIIIAERCRVSRR